MNLWKTQHCNSHIKLIEIIITDKNANGISLTLIGSKEVDWIDCSRVAWFPAWSVAVHSLMVVQPVGISLSTYDMDGLGSKVSLTEG